MKLLRYGLAAAAAASLLSACSGSSVQQSLEPKSTSVNPLTAKLQFAVGTANVAGTLGLNTVVTLRQTAAGYVGTSVLTNYPTITGPGGFVVPSTTDAGADAGTNHISAVIVTSLTNPPAPTTFTNFPYSGIASSYGFLPAGVNISSLTPLLVPYPLPFYVSVNPALSTTPVSIPYTSALSDAAGNLPYIGGPPAFVAAGHTSTLDGTFPAGYLGYVLGFVDFQATPVTGAYNLNVVIPTGINQTTGAENYGSLTATAALSALSSLPAWSSPPTFASDGTGGGTITTNFPSAVAGVTEEYVELVNTGPAACVGPDDPGVSPPYFYTFRLTPGQAAVTVPDNIGPALVGKPQPHTLCTASEDGTSTGDGYALYGFAVDYPLAEAGFPASTGNAAPVITGSRGTDDVTTSAATTGNAM